MQLTRRRLLQGLVALPAVMAVAARFGHTHEVLSAPASAPLRIRDGYGNWMRQVPVGGHAAALARSARLTKERLGAEILNRAFK